MNILFWLIAATMIMIALLMVVSPLFRKPDSLGSDDGNQRNIQIARDRLADLKANKASGGISDAQYEEQVAELELALSDDLSLPQTALKPSQTGRWLAYVLIALIPLLSITLYGFLGDYQAIGRINDAIQSGQSQADNSSMPSPEAINNMVEKLADKLKSDPDNLEGWLMLGKSYKVLQRYNDSEKAYERAFQLAGDKTDVMLLYAEAIALAAGGNWHGKPMDLVNKALALEPENLNSLWFAATANAQQGDKQTSLVYLRKLRDLLPDNAQDKRQIQELVANIESQLSGSIKPVIKDQSQAPAIPGIVLDVMLAPELKSRVKSDDALFIYAQALSGPKMPLAIIRKRAGDLPFSGKLTDADGMLPNMKLSDFNQVKLLARISNTGNAMPQPGDLMGVIEVVDTGTEEKHVLVINQAIK